MAFFVKKNAPHRAYALVRGETVRFYRGLIVAADQSSQRIENASSKRSAQWPDG